MSKIRLVFEEDGFPRELASVEELKRALDEARLTENTFVTVYRSDGAATALPAGQVVSDLASQSKSELKTKVAARKRPRKTAQPSENSSGLSTQKHQDGKPETLATSQAVQAEIPAGTPDANSPADPDFGQDEESSYEYEAGFLRETADKPSWPKIVALVFVTGFALWFFALENSGDGPEEARTLTYLVTAPTNIRVQPIVSSEQIAQLESGSEVVGIFRQETSDGIRWLEIYSAPYAGNYMSMSNLQEISSQDGVVEADPEVSKASANWTASNLPEDMYQPCAGDRCRVLDSSGWAGLDAGMRISQLEAKGFYLNPEGNYDGFLDDTFSCNIYGLQGAPEALTVMVENAVVTNIHIRSGERTSKEFRTNRGISIGDSEADVRNSYADLEERPSIYTGPPDKDLFYWSNRGTGIKFEIRDGAVETMTFGLGSIEYVEGCL